MNNDRHKEATINNVMSESAQRTTIAEREANRKRIKIAEREVNYNRKQKNKQIMYNREDALGHYCYCMLKNSRS